MSSTVAFFQNDSSLYSDLFGVPCLGLGRVCRCRDINMGIVSAERLPIARVQKHGIQILCFCFGIMCDIMSKRPLWYTYICGHYEEETVPSLNTKGSTQLGLDVLRTFVSTSFRTRGPERSMCHE